MAYVEVDYEKELDAIVHERQAGVDRFEHVTTIARAGYSEYVRMTNFLLAQGEHGGQLKEINRKVDVLTDRVDGLTDRVDGLTDRVDGLERTMRQGFAAVDERFEAIDQRFEVIDQRFEAIDQRFEVIDRRFDAMDRRFDAMDTRFDAMEQRMDAKMETFADRVLKGVAAQLKTLSVPVAEGERRGYRA